MYTYKTTLILGAGASVNYGYPTGSALIQQVSTQDFQNIFTDKITPTEWKKRLKQAQPQSIDYFMHLNEELMLSVKPYVFLYLLSKESDDKTLTLDYSQHWYNRFFDSLITKNVEETKRNLSNIKIITFNYDRSLEYYLSRMIKQRCYHDDADYIQSFKLLKNMEINHVYGRLPQLVNEDESDKAGVDYGSVKQGHLSTSEANRHTGLVNQDNLFKICYEKVDDTVKSTNQNFLKDADNVLFLGFGFHKENMDILNFKFDDKGIKYYATGYGLSGAKKFELGQNFEQIQIHDKKSHELVEHFYDIRMPTKAASR